MARPSAAAARVAWPTRQKRPVGAFGSERLGRRHRGREAIEPAGAVRQAARVDLEAALPAEPVELQKEHHQARVPALQLGGVEPHPRGRLEVPARRSGRRGQRASEPPGAREVKRARSAPPHRSGSGARAPPPAGSLRPSLGSDPASRHDTGAGNSARAVIWPAPAAAAARITAGHRNQSPWAFHMLAPGSLR